MKRTEPSMAAEGNGNMISTNITSRHKRTLREIWKDYKRAKYIMLLLLPAIIWYSVFYYAPFYGVQIAFKNYNLLEGIAKSPWVGLDQFRHMFTASNDFGRIIRNTIIISFYHILFGFPAPVVLALLFNELRWQKFKRFTQSITYLPHFLSWVVLAGLLTTILSPSEGIINFIIKALGFKEIYFMGNPDYFRFTLVVSAMWKEIGWGTIIYLAALAGVNPHLYEAAVMDGASRWKQTMHITIPQIMPVIAIMFILRIGSLLDAGFDQILNMYNPAVYSVSDILDTYVYRVGILQLQYSFTTAVGLFKNVIAFGMVLITNYIIKKGGQEGLF